MPTYKINYFFTQRTYGWTETFYWDGATPDGALTAAVNVLPSRVAMLGGTVGDGSSPRVKEIRVSNVAVQRDSLIGRVSLGDGTPANPLGTADNPNLCLLLRVQSGDRYRRQLYLRGNPDSLVANNGIYTLSAVWTNLFNVWRDRVIAEDFGIHAVTVDPAPAGNFIASIANGPPVVITSVANHGLIDQDSVRIILAPGVTGIRGNWRVSVGTPLTFTLLGAIAAGTYLGGGAWYKRVYGTKRITQMGIMEATHRITGRPFDSPRGRRSRKARV